MAGDVPIFPNTGDPSPACGPQAVPEYRLTLEEGLVLPGGSPRPDCAPAAGPALSGPADSESRPAPSTGRPATQLEVLAVPVVASVLAVSNTFSVNPSPGTSSSSTGLPLLLGSLPVHFLSGSASGNTTGEVKRDPGIGSESLVEPEECSPESPLPSATSRGLSSISASSTASGSALGGASGHAAIGISTGEPQAGMATPRIVDNSGRDADLAQRRLDQSSRTERLRNTGVLDLSVARLLDELLKLGARVLPNSEKQELQDMLAEARVKEKARADAAALQKQEERAHWEWVPAAAVASTRQREEFAAAGVSLSVAELRAQLASLGVPVPKLTERQEMQAMLVEARRCASDGARKAADRASSDALLAAQARRRTEEVGARAAAAQAAQRMAAVETSKHTSDGAALAGAARVLHTRGADVAAHHVTQVPASPSMSGRHKFPHPSTAHASGGAGGGRGAGSSEGRHAAMDEDIGAMSVKEIKGELAWWGVDFASYSSQEDLRILLGQARRRQEGSASASPVYHLAAHSMSTEDIKLELDRLGIASNHCKFKIELEELLFKARAEASRHAAFLAAQGGAPHGRDRSTRAGAGAGVTSRPTVESLTVEGLKEELRRHGIPIGKALNKESLRAKVHQARGIVAPAGPAPGASRASSLHDLTRSTGDLWQEIRNLPIARVKELLKSNKLDGGFTDSESDETCRDRLYQAAMCAPTSELEKSSGFPCSIL